MPTDHQELQGWDQRKQNCDLKNALEFSDSATIAKMASLISRGNNTTRGKVALMASLIEEPDAKRRVVQGARQRCRHQM